MHTWVKTAPWTGDKQGVMERRPHILVVDPDADHLQLMQRTLTKQWAVDIASSGEEGLALAQGTNPHLLVIADQRLPDMSGLQFLNTIGARDPHVGRMLLTNYGDTQATIEAVEGGRVDAFISKPCMPQQLCLMVGSILERCELERENSRLVQKLTAKNEELRGTLDSLRARGGRFETCRLCSRTNASRRCSRIGSSGRSSRTARTTVR